MATAGRARTLIPDDVLHHESPSRRRTAKILVFGLLLWAAPVVAFALATGPHSVFTTQGLFFSGTALVTFGGAYAVLTYVAQQAVETYGWLSANDMVRGLALAETTPGPLIMVVQFVAFLGAFNDPGTLNPWVAGVAGLLRHLGDVRAVLPVHLSRRSLHRTPARQPVAERRPHRYHGRRRRRHRQPRRLLRRAHPVLGHAADHHGPARRRASRRPASGPPLWLSWRSRACSCSGSGGPCCACSEPAPLSDWPPDSSAHQSRDAM